MTKTIQHVRGTTAQNDAFTGASGEITVDSTTNELRLHDGSTAGGHCIYNKDDVDTLLSSKTTQTDIDTSISSAIATLLTDLYPVGSLYMSTKSTCALATLIPGSTWQKIEGRYLLASGTLVGTSETYIAPANVSAGAPNITGTFSSHNHSLSSPSGAFSGSSNGSSAGLSGIGSYPGKITFNARNSNNIYGESNTVRPPAYVVNVWRRTA